MAGFQNTGLNFGEALAVPATAAVTNGMHLGANGVWQYPPGYLLSNDLGAAVTTTGTETTCLAGGDISGIFPLGVAIGDMVHIYAWGTWTPTGAQTLTINVYMASTIIATYTSASFSATLRNWLVNIRVPYTILGAAGTGQIRPSGTIFAGGAGGTGFDSLSAASSEGFGGSVITTGITTAAASTGNIKLQMSNSSGSAVCQNFQARYYPKSY